MTITRTNWYDRKDCSFSSCNCHALTSIIVSIATDGESVLALCILYYLLPDTRAKPDHTRVLMLTQVKSIYMHMYTNPRMYSIFEE